MCVAEPGSPGKAGVPEFNSMFASCKGEGTGVVRHMFSHHDGSTRSISSMLART